MVGGKFFKANRMKFTKMKKKKNSDEIVFPCKRHSMGSFMTIQVEISSKVGILRIYVPRKLRIESLLFNLRTL